MTHRLIFHDCVDHGTQIPYIKRAIKVINILTSYLLRLLIRHHELSKSLARSTIFVAGRLWCRRDKHKSKRSTC